ncbi:MAG: DUF2157 domain-containing protein [Psychrobacter sp.]|nr:DUF2157 domain-containing protein [Psychrobacter sp.]
MSQSRRTIEQLLQQSQLPLSNAEAAATHLQVYPSASTWRSFFDKAALIIGVIALSLALVFFIAYNWQGLGKIGKFALVEGALAMTIALYVALSFRKRFAFIRQLLLLIASIITGSLLALFGQVYQTGADTWQLFAAWAVLIIPWVVIARFPALWLLWLGLINALTLLYIDTSIFANLDYYYQNFWRFTLIAIVNFTALSLWLCCFEHKRLKRQNASVHWSTYTVALLSAYNVSSLTISTVFDNKDFLLLFVAASLWLSWCGFIYWRFKRQHFDLLMLTYLCGSIIAVVMCWAIELKPSNMDAGGLLILAILLISISSYAVTWLRQVARANYQSNEHNTSHTVVKGCDYE